MAETPQFRIPTWFPDLAPSTLELLGGFHHELLKFNKTINLISGRTVMNADQLHFADSILGAQIVGADSNASTFHDFGSGNGFPGVVMSILFPAVQVVLVESDRRKAEFLKHSVASLGLSNAEIHVGRVESLGSGSVQAAVCRGFANLSRTLLFSRKLFEVGGRIYNFKGPEWAHEIGSLPEQICSTWNTLLLGEYLLPSSEITHCVVVAERTR